MVRGIEEVRGNGQFGQDTPMTGWKVLGRVKGADLPRARITDVIGKLHELGEVVEQPVYVRRVDMADETPLNVEELVRADGFKGLYNLKFGEIVGIPTSSYTTIQHYEAFMPFFEELEKAGEKEVVYNIEEYSGKVNMGVWLDHDITPDDGEPVKMGFVLRNSFDSTNAVHFAGAGIRYICGNFSMWGYLFGKASYKHTGDKDYKLGQLRNFITSIDFRGQKVVEIINQANQKHLDAEKAELLLKVFEFPEGFSESVMQRFRTAVETQRTYYRLYCDITNVASNSTNKKTGEMTYTDERTYQLADRAEDLLVDFGKRRIKAAIEKAEEAEKLKTAAMAVAR